MRSLFLGGIALATALMIQSAPSSAQGVYGARHPHIGHGYSSHHYAGHGPGRFQYQRHGYGTGNGVGAGIAALAAGALIGGAIASQNQGYYPVETYPVYADPGYGYQVPAGYSGGGSVAYCEQTYRSYNPASGTYLGYDGFRHPCP